MKNKDRTPEKAPANKWIKYTGIGFQMLATIGLGAFGGMALDKKLNTSVIFTVTLSLLGVAIAMYLVIKDFLKPKK